MRSEDTEAFSRVVEDLCLAFNRPCTDELKRVFAESLKHVGIIDVKRAAASWRRNGRKFPTPKDLMPEKPAAAPRKAEVLPEFSPWGRAANKILLRLSMNCGGIGDATLARALTAKADYVGMAEQAERSGEKWSDEEFIGLVDEGLAQILADSSADEYPSTVLVVAGKSIRPAQFAAEMAARRRA